MSISANFPNVRPSLLLDFANSQQLDPRVTFSRSTTAPYYDGKTSVLAEQNLFIQSNSFTNAAWVSTNATIASGVTAPDGTATAYSMTATAGNATLYQTLTLTATAYTESIWIQRVTGTGTINLTLDGTTLSPVTITSSWAKYTYTATPTAGAKTIGIQIVTSGDAINIYGSQIENRSSATATNITTTSALTNYIPQLLTAPINQPRFYFNPTTGESLGLLIEQSSTNLLTYSQDFSNAVWTKSNATITATSNIAPDGTQTASLFSENTASSTHQMYRLGTTAGTYTFTLYAKAYGRTQIQIEQENGGNSRFTLSGNGTALALGSNTVSITFEGNGWYRCSTTFTATTGIGIYIGTYNNGLSYTGNGYSGIYIWGAQLEALAFPTSYIPTTSAQVTRAADVATMTGTNFSSWYNQGQGTFYFNYSRINTGSATSFPALFTTNTLLEFADGITEAIKSIPSNSQYNAGSVTKLERKLMIAYSPSVGLASAIDGGNYLSNSSLLITNTSATYFTFGVISGNEGSNYFKKISYYPQALTQAQLQALTGS